MVDTITFEASPSRRSERYTAILNRVSPARDTSQTSACRMKRSENEGGHLRMKKPPPITPRRFTRFFTPRLRNTSDNVQTSRAALQTLTGSNVNKRNNTRPQTLQIPSEGTTASRGKKRKLSFVLNERSATSSPISRINILSSQEIRSSPTIPERRSPLKDYDCADLCDTEDETDIEEDETDSHKPTRMLPYRSKSTFGSRLDRVITGRRRTYETPDSALWQNETGHFYSEERDINSYQLPRPALPFCVTSCNTNPMVAVGDEDGLIRLLDTSDEYEPGISHTWLSMRPHDNAIMDIEFSEDDRLIATACGDQTCQIIDVPTQKSLSVLVDHRCSVKRIAFQPGSGSNVLASCGRDGQINFWDLRCNNAPKQPSSRRSMVPLPMTDDMKQVTSTHSVRDAHAAGIKSKNQKGRQNLVPGRTEFSVTCLSFLKQSSSHLLVTASEIDTAMKVWDIRSNFGNNRRAPIPVSVTEQPRSHAHQRAFGVNSIVLNTDGTRLYALSRDHTVYAYSTSHLILGSDPHFSPKSKAFRSTESNTGLGPLYGFRHPNLIVSTFWPRLSIRKASATHSELLAVGSSDDCAVLFPTDERYLTQSTKSLPPAHKRAAEDLRQTRQSSSFTTSTSTRPPLTRSVSSSFNARLSSMLNNDNGNENNDNIRIYQHGTPLVRGHDKEVTSLSFATTGNLITASDDYSVRCWREDRGKARQMRSEGESNGNRWKKGWSNVGIDGFDIEDEDDEC